MRIEQLTFTRFIAAMAIVFFDFGKPLNIFSQPIIHKLLVQANIGVSYFFLLSGFVMVIAYGRKSKVHSFSFLKNRLARIYPIYFIAIVLSILYRYLENIPFSNADLFLNIFLIQSWFPGRIMSINFPGWSLPVEMLFYVAFPFTANYIFRKFPIKKITFMIISFWIVSQLFFILSQNLNWSIGPEKTTDEFFFSFPLFHLNQFLMGNLAGLYFIRKKHTPKNYDIYLIFFTFLIIIALLFRPSFLYYHNGLLAILFIPFIYLLALNSGFLTTFFTKKPLVYLGEISYGIYILQVPVYWFTKYFMLKAGIEGSLKIFLVYVSLLLIISMLSYTFIETPLREKIKRSRIKLNF